jgi:hypothetical protein
MGTLTVPGGAGVHAFFSGARETSMGSRDAGVVSGGGPFRRLRLTGNTSSPSQSRGVHTTLSATCAKPLKTPSAPICSQRSPRDRPPCTVAKSELGRDQIGPDIGF